MGRHVRASRRAALAAAVALFPFASKAQLATLNLDCGWIESFDSTKNAMEPTRGSAFYTITFHSDNAGIARQQGLGAEFKVAANDTEISGETSYYIGQVFFRQQFNLNRYTGRIESSLAANGNSLTHYGHCKTVQRRQF